MSAKSLSELPVRVSDLPSDEHALNAFLDDDARLSALESYGILDSETETAFDDIARLAAGICETPVGFVTFVSDRQQFFKASIGADGAREAPMHSGFCPFTVAKANMLVIPDTQANPRYADNPVVTGAPFVRFYAGVPLRSPEGHALGTVCVVDRQPRELRKDQIDALAILARQVETLLALRLAVRNQAQALRERDAIAQARVEAEVRLHETASILQQREQRIRILYELTSRLDLSFQEKVQGLLRAGREWLHADIAILARTDCETGKYTVVQIDAAGESGPVGFACDLDQTFCGEAVQHSPGAPPLTIENASVSESWREHPGYEAFGCEAYIGAVVRVGGVVWGTIAFIAHTPRAVPFTDFDRDIVRLRAQWIGGELARQEAEDALRANVAQQRRFVREMLASVTEGKLCLSDSPQDLPDALSPASGTVELTPSTLRLLRQRVETVANDLHLPKERKQDLLTAVGEAGMNAIRHGGGGVGHVHADPKNHTIQVWIQDHGKGIREEDLHRATLEKGWSGGGSLGHGFFLMLRTVDRTYLLTGAGGTTVVLEQEAAPPQPAWLTS